jgi:putative endopeptidase
MKNILWGLAALSLAACAAMGVESKSSRSGIDRANFGAGVRPQDDLYRAVNGTWLARTEIPADKSNYGAFTKLADDAEADLREIIEDTAGRRFDQGTDAQRVGDFYRSFMAEKELEALGLKPLTGELARIDALKSAAELPPQMAHLVQIGVNAPLVPLVHQDRKDSDHYIGDFYQGGLGLPDRDYYLLDDAKFADIRTKYQAHIEKMLTLAGIADAAAAAAAILAFEKRLAKAHWDKVDNRNPQKTYNKFTVAKLDDLSDQIDWPPLLQAAGFAKLEAVIVAQPSYVKAVGAELRKTKLDTWKRYFKWRVISAYAPMLSKAFVDENFEFYGRILNGIQQQKPRWKRGVAVVQHGNGNPDSPANEALGEALGKIYVARRFPPQSKAAAEKLVQNLLVAYDQEFATLDWMSAETQQAAKRKLAKFRYKIGYPDRWRDFSALSIDPDDLVGNVMRVAQFDYQRDIKKLGGPIDREEWGMTPQAVNAYYNPEKNEIVFPAAILQPPFFDARADDAVNYGGIGAVIGHEISHGFDDQGSQFDGDGNLKSWWTKADQKKFDERAALLAKQYDAYEPVKGFKLNGKFTLGENIADLGGLTIAHKAYQISLGGQPAPVLDGLTGDQRFFMGWAQVWRRNYREENLLNRIKSDPHSPSEYRCNGVVINMPAFYNAFGVTKADKLYKPESERIRIW